MRCTAGSLLGWGSCSAALRCIGAIVGNRMSFGFWCTSFWGLRQAACWIVCAVLGGLLGGCDMEALGSAVG